MNLFVNVIYLVQQNTKHAEIFAGNYELVNWVVFKRHSLIAMFFCLIILSSIKANAVTFTITAETEWIKQRQTIQPGTSVKAYNILEINARAGDTIQFEKGTRKAIRFDDLMGDSLHPVIVCNKDHLVTITQPQDGYYGMAFNHCRYVKLTGGNNAELLYGFQITDIPNGSGISINNFSSNFEVEGLLIDGVGSAGIVAKTDPDCENYEAYKSFIMYDLRFHHNMIRHAGNEGFYIGNTGYREGAGIPLNCHDPSFNVHVLPHKIIGVKVYQNVCDSTGWDGIQVSSSTHAEVYENYIIHDSYSDYPNQLSGIIIGEPTQAKVYNNIIKNGKGIGIQCFGVGVKIFNNVIVDPADSKWAKSNSSNKIDADKNAMGFAIYINDKVCKDSNVMRLPYLVAHNTIVIENTYKVGKIYGPHGIDVSEINYVKNNHVINNLVVINTDKNGGLKPVIEGVYTDDLMIELDGLSDYIKYSKHTKIGGNYYSSSINTLHFTAHAKDDYSLKRNSPAIDAGWKKAIKLFPVLKRDIAKVKRPKGMSADCGAYEYVFTRHKRK